MSRFHNPVPVDIDFSSVEQVEPKGTGVDLMDDLTPEPSEQPEQIELKEEHTNPEEVESIADIVPTEEIVEEEETYEDNIYLKTINNLVDKGVIVEPYEGFTEDTEPTQEVLEKFLEHNLELRDNKVIEDFVGNISPLLKGYLSLTSIQKDRTWNFISSP